MDDNFMNEVWKLGLDNPELRETIARSITKESKGYTIPTWYKSKLTGEYEDITINVQEVEDPKLRGIMSTVLKVAQRLTVKDLARLQAILRTGLRAKEATGEKLSDEEETLRDIDILGLALAIIAELTTFNKDNEPKPEGIEEVL